MSWLLNLLGGVSKDDFEKQNEKQKEEFESISEALKITTEALITMNAEVSSIKNLQVDPVDIQKAVEKGLEKERSKIKLLFATLEASAEKHDKDQDAAISRLGLVLTGDADGDGEMDEFGQGGVRQKVDMVWSRVEDLEESGSGTPTVNMASLVTSVGEMYDELFPHDLEHSKIDQNHAAIMKMIDDVIVPEITAVKNSIAMASAGVQNQIQNITKRLDYIDNGDYVRDGINPHYTFQELAVAFSAWEQMLPHMISAEGIGTLKKEEIMRQIRLYSHSDQEYTRERCAIVNSAVESMASEIAVWMQDMQKDLGIQISESDLERYNKWFSAVPGSHEEFMSERRHYSWDKNRDGTSTGINTPNDSRYRLSSGKQWYSKLASNHTSIASVSDGRIKSFESGEQGDYQEFLDFYPVVYNGINENSGDDSIGFRKLESSRDIDSEYWSIAPGQTTFPTYENLQLIEHKLYLLWKLIKDNADD